MSEERALPLRVYVPREGTAARAGIAEHSGAVGTPIGGGRVVLDFEANMYGAANIKTYADAVHHAAGRHLWGPRVTPRAPGPRRTRMRLSMSASTTANGPEQRRTIAEWLGVGEERVEAECQRTE